MTTHGGPPVPVTEFTEFARSRADALKGAAYLLTGDRALADDLVQATLEKVYRKWHTIEPGNHGAYAHRVLVNVSNKWWRRRWHDERPAAELPDTVAVDGWETVDARADLLRALGKLPPGQRTVLALRFLLDLTQEETAAAMGCAPGTVKSQASKGLARLRTDDTLRPQPTATEG